MEVSNLVPFGHISKSLNHHIFCKNLAVSAQKSLGLPQLTQNYQKEWFRQFKGRKKESKGRKKARKERKRGGERKEWMKRMEKGVKERKGRGEKKGGGDKERKGRRRKN